MGLWGGGDHGKGDADRRAAVRLTLDPDIAPALFDNAVHGGQAEAGALPDLLRRKERLEQMRFHVRRHAGAGVDDLEERVRPGGGDRKSTRLNSSHQIISYAVFCLKK